jgi:hypothetical protein
MKTRNPFTKAVFTAIIIILFSVTSPQDALADDGWRSFAGSWFVEITPDPGGPPPFTNLATVHWAGTIVTSDPILGGGHGAWNRTGKRDFEIRFLVLVPPDNPLGLPPNTTLTVTAFLTVGDSGDEANGTNIGEFSDSAGNVIAVVAGDVRFTRIKVDH